MKALSIRQPWAWLIVHGHKNIENRTWTTEFRGEFLIHAGLNLYGTPEERAKIRSWASSRFGIIVPDDDKLKRGGIVGRSHLVDVVHEQHSPGHEQLFSPWFFGPYGFVLEHSRPSAFKECAGRLGFFEPYRIGHYAER
jgi:hypothetical protein